MSTLEILTFPSGPIETNAYIAVDLETKDALLVDAPSGVTESLLLTVKNRGLNVTEIVITHGHWDHIGDTKQLKDETGVEVRAHHLTVPKMENPGSSLGQIPVEIPPSTADRLLDDGDTVTVGKHQFDVWFLPGHDPGHIVLVSVEDGVVLGGDVLFPNGHGRIDIPGADADQMQASLRRLAALPDDTIVYPGHGLPTTIGRERGWLPK